MASTVYALKCKNGKYYVGKTTDVRMRVGQHCEGDGSVWTSMHEPISVAYVKHGCDPFDEDKITKQFMAKYGIDNVRGGSYTQVTIEPHIKKLIETELASANDACFRCGRKGHFASSCFAKTSANRTRLSSPGFGETQPASANNTCFRCGHIGHFVSSCFAKTSTNGTPLSSPGFGRRRPRRQQSWSDSEWDTDSE